MVSPKRTKTAPLPESPGKITEKAIKIAKKPGKENSQDDYYMAVKPTTNN